MVQSRTQLVWALAACAAVFAQLTPRPLCQACDQACCASQTNDRAPQSTDAGAALAGACPLCSSEPGRRLIDTSDRPCHCQFEARQDQPLALSRSTLPSAADEALAVVPTVAPSLVPLALDVSREYLAASLAIPIRPLRILFGVWRN